MPLNDIAKHIKSLSYQDMRFLAEDILCIPLTQYVQDLVAEDRLDELCFDYFATLLLEWAEAQEESYKVSS